MFWAIVARCCCTHVVAGVFIQLVRMIFCGLNKFAAYNDILLFSICMLSYALTSYFWYVLIRVHNFRFFANDLFNVFDRLFESHGSDFIQPKSR